MTVTEKPARKIISGSGWSNPLTFDIYIESSSHIEVWADDELLDLGVDYTVAGVQDADGFEVTITDEGMAPDAFILYHRPPLTQGTDLSGGGVFGSAYMAGLDAIMRRMQSLEDRVNRSFKLGLATALDADEPTVPAAEDGKFLGWAGTVLANVNILSNGDLTVVDDDDLSLFGDSVALRQNVKAYVDANAAIDLPALAANTFLVTNAAATARENKPFADVRDLLDTAPYAATRTALKALDTTKESVAFLSESGREGWFVWKAGNYTSHHAVDTQEGVYVKATAIASSAGSWVRVFDHEIMPEWFGAVGDYSADDYTALNAAVIFAKTYSVPLLLTGEYRINTTLACGSINGITEKLTIRGKGTIAGAVSGSVMTIGNASATSFTGYVTLEDITIAKYPGYSPSEGLVLIDVVRSKFIRLTTEGLAAGTGVLMQGGIALSFDNCSFDWNAIGLKIMKFTSLAGGGYPNLISIRNSLIINNSVYGLEFSSGRHLIIDGCDIEGNGNNDASWKGGVIINSNIGEESSLSFALGLTITNCWLEANSGGSALILLGGTNTVRDCYFVTNSATYDIYIGGGRHRIHGTQHDTNKTIHIIREGSAGSANVIENARKADGNVANITLP